MNKVVIKFIGTSRNELLEVYKRLSEEIIDAEDREYGYIRKDLIREAYQEKVELKRTRMALAEYLLEEFDFDVLDERTRNRYNL